MDNGNYKKLLEKQIELKEKHNRLKNKTLKMHVASFATFLAWVGTLSCLAISYLTTKFSPLTIFAMVATGVIFASNIFVTSCENHFNKALNQLSVKIKQNEEELSKTLTNEVSKLETKENKLEKFSKEQNIIQENKEETLTK